MGEENEKNQILITTADPNKSWTNVVKCKMTGSLKTTLVDDDNDNYFIFKNNETYEVTGSLKLSHLNDKIIRAKIFNLPECPLKKKKLNKKSFIKALMANGIPRNQAERASWLYKKGKGYFSYPKQGDAAWKWLWG